MNGDLEFWNELLEKEIQTTTKYKGYTMGIASKGVKILLISHNTNDGKLYMDAVKHRIDRTYGTHA